jgi:FixJ family two-component response regulator
MCADRPFIFVVDDDLSFRTSLVRLLKVHGFSAAAFSSARSFLDAVSPDRSGIAVLDIHMPECDGFALFEKMKERHYRMPVIFITGQAHPEDHDPVLLRGARGFLIKPFREESLLDILTAGESL